MNSHQRRKFVKAAMSELRGACQSELERGLVDAAADHIKQEKMIDKLHEQIATLTRQHDLAIKALESIAGRRMFIDNLASNVDIAVMTLDAIKESEK